MENDIIEIKYAMDTFYFLISGVLVMWMAAGFTMLEAGLVRSKNTTEILAKNVALYSIACVMYLIMGYTVMYGRISMPYEFSSSTSLCNLRQYPQSMSVKTFIIALVPPSGGKTIMSLTSSLANIRSRSETKRSSSTSTKPVASIL